ncbi:MAG TPA: hypothetical protein VEW95_09525 [Candidatus Limnocylindrales bacterium]|nr:hypothetical protein [Candidatus Limnocylindrales bacterium]
MSEINWVEVGTNVAIGLEVLAAMVLVWFNFRESRFLEDKVRPLLHVDEDLPLFDALAARAKYVTAVGIYLIVLTGLGQAGYSVAEVFPPIRAINGLLFLGLIAGPWIIGRALRNQADVKAENESEPEAVA